MNVYFTKQYLFYLAIINCLSVLIIIQSIGMFKIDKKKLKRIKNDND